MVQEEIVRALQQRTKFQCLCFAITLASLSFFFVSLMVSMQHKLNVRMDAIEKHHESFSSHFDDTMKSINSTVEKVQENVDQQVQEVNDNVSSQNSLMAYQFAGTFAILGSLISFWHMAGHLQKMHAPIVQRKIIAILWMIPIYSVSSFLSLVFVQAESFLSLFKDIYEAYVIYTFLSFLISIIGRGDRDAVIDLLAKYADDLKQPLHLPFQSNPIYQTDRQKAEAVLNQNQLFTMQFVFLRPLTTIAIIIADEYHESRWDPSHPQIYINIITNISIFFAFTGLLRFYHAVKEDLNWCHPFSKFLSIKMIVFLTFWQSVVISFIAHAVYKGNDDENASKDATEWSKQAQSFIICFEMFAFAIVHCQVFPTEEWEPGFRERQKRRIKASFGDSLALKDFVSDVKVVMKSKRKERYKKLEAKKKVATYAYDKKDTDDSISELSASQASDGVDPNGFGPFEIGDESDHSEEDGWNRIEEFIEEIEDGDDQKIDVDEKMLPCIA